MSGVYLGLEGGFWVLVHRSYKVIGKGLNYNKTF